MSSWDGIFVLGPTASGKSDLAIELAQVFDGELVCVDSRTVYRGMDIGTAKPSLDEQKKIPHYLLDIANVFERVTPAEFHKAVQKAVKEIKWHGKVPIFVGGATVFGHVALYRPRINADQDYSHRTVDALQSELAQRNLPLPLNPTNRTDLIGYLTTFGEVQSQEKPLLNMIQIGVQRTSETLHERVCKRTDAMLRAGLEKEVRALVDANGWCDILASTIGYQEFRPYFAGSETLKDVWQGIVDNTMEMAKYQERWFKKDPNTTWVKTYDEAIELCRGKL